MHEAEQSATGIEALVFVLAVLALSVPVLIYAALW